VRNPKTGTIPADPAEKPGPKRGPAKARRPLYDSSSRSITTRHRAWPAAQRVFLHLARENSDPTAGCVCHDRSAILRLCNGGSEDQHCHRVTDRASGVEPGMLDKIRSLSPRAGCWAIGAPGTCIRRCRPIGRRSPRILACSEKVSSVRIVRFGRDPFGSCRRPMNYGAQRLRSRTRMWVAPNGSRSRSRRSCPWTNSSIVACGDFGGHRKVRRRRLSTGGMHIRPKWPDRRFAQLGDEGIRLGRMTPAYCGSSRFS